MIEESLPRWARTHPRHVSTTGDTFQRLEQHMTHHSRKDEPLVTIASYPTSFEASLAKGALEAAGIAAFVPNETVGTFSRNRGGIPVGALQVFECDRDRAVAELRRLDLRVAEPTDD